MSVRVERIGRAISIVLERPPLNVLDISLLRELDGVLEDCAADSEADIVVLRGAGNRAFSAGVDIKDHTRQKAPEMLDIVHRAMRQLLALPQVTIAHVQGACLGGGCELASCCDFVLASDDSSFATPEILVGCYPPVALARFSSLIGYRRAADMILTGRNLTAQEALSVGLISRVAPREQLESALTALLDDLLGKSGSVLRLTLKGLRELSLRGFADALERSEQIYRDELLSTEDVEEGVRAFLEKRKPRWTRH
jgi:cyclohexa-1,5-dienecarbonyl-CoA hydratase